MRTLLHFVGLFIVTACLTVESTAHAAVYGTPASLTGSRTVAGAPGGLSTAEADWQDATLSWTIVNNGNGTFNYSYTFNGINAPSTSHWVLDLSNDAFSGTTLIDPLVVTNATITDSTGTSTPTLEFGTKDGIVGAVKFDTGTEDASVTYAFTSNRSPVYGDFFLKGGQTNLTNTGFGNLTSENAIDYIARPNGLVPEPASLALIGGAAILLLRRKRA